MRTVLAMTDKYDFVLALKDIVAGDNELIIKSVTVTEEEADQMRELFESDDGDLKVWDDYKALITMEGARV